MPVCRNAAGIFSDAAYIQASATEWYCVLYTSVTFDLIAVSISIAKRLSSEFTPNTGSKRLVWLEQHGTMKQAILREKRIQKWNRA